MTAPDLVISLWPRFIVCTCCHQRVESVGLMVYVDDWGEPTAEETGAFCEICGPCNATLPAEMRAGQ